MYRRYGGASERQELVKVDKVFRDSNQTGDGFKSRVAIVVSWINTTFGMIGDTYRSKEVKTEQRGNKVCFRSRLGCSQSIYRNNDEFGQRKTLEIEIVTLPKLRTILDMLLTVY